MDIRAVSSLFSVSTTIFIRKETSPTLNRDGGHFQRFTIHFLKHQDQGHRQRRVPGVDQSTAIQLPSAEDGEGFLQNIRSKNVSFFDSNNLGL